MKPFNLERALAGDPVITRDGDPVKIAGYNEDAGTYHQVSAWVDAKVFGWDMDGRFDPKEHPYDLFMAPTDRKEWVVIHKIANGVLNAYGPFEKSFAEDCAKTLNGTIHEITITD